ncbi:MAG: flagellar filament capping protein FliD [bacterium]|nr:flagellar filament capping protein FliD [bacterium]
MSTSILAGIGSGMMSGIDTEQLVEALITIDRHKAVKWEAEKTSNELKTQSLLDINTKLLTLQTRSTSLLSKTLFETKKATVTDEDIFSAAVSSNAIAGSYNIEVLQLATPSVSQSTGELNDTTGIGTNAFKSQGEVVRGRGKIDTSKSFKDAGFEHAIDGSVTISGNGGTTKETFYLAAYDTVQDFLDDVSTSANSKVNLLYDANQDVFTINSDVGSTVIFSAAGTNDFFKEVNLSRGVVADAKLSDADFGVNDVDALSAGSFRVNGVKITWDADTDSLNTILSRINNSTAGVTAFYDPDLDKIVLTSKSGGAAPISVIDEQGTFAANSLNLSSTYTEGQVARIKVNGSDVIEKNSNTFTLGSGLTLNLKKLGSATVNVTQDTSGAETAIKSFVEEFNAIIDIINKETVLDLESKKKGILQGSSAVENIAHRLLSLATDRYNIKTALTSSQQVTNKRDTGIDKTKSFNAAAFDTTPDGTLTINGAAFSIGDYSTVENFMHAINDYQKSSTGTGVSVTVSNSWATSGLGFTPGSGDKATINGATFNLSNYTTVSEFMQAVNDSTQADATITYANNRFTIRRDTANRELDLAEEGTDKFFSAARISVLDPEVTISYSQSEDKFKIEANTQGAAIILSATGTNDFLSEVNITAGTYTSPSLDSALDELAEIGITTGSFDDKKMRDKLVIDEAKLKDALLANPQKVQDLFGKDTDGDLVKDYGVGFSFKEFLKLQTKTGGETTRGIIRGEINLLSQQNKRIDEDISDLDRRLEMKEVRLRRQFTAMEQAFAQSQSVMQNLQRIGALNNNNRKK